jgi:hypothetical protein
VAKARVGAQYDPDLGPALAQLRHEAADSTTTLRQRSYAMKTAVFCHFFFSPPLLPAYCL